MAPENPQAEASEGSPKLSGWWPGDMSLGGMSSLHAYSATAAAMQADAAAKQATQLSHCVQVLWEQITMLQKRILELEDWKRKALDDMTKLRFEHKILRRQVVPDEAEEHPMPGKAKSLPAIAQPTGEAKQASQRKLKTVPTAALPKAQALLRPPPGLEKVPDPDGHAGKQVRFAEASAESSPSQGSPSSPADDSHLEIHPSRSVSSASMASVVSEITEALDPNDEGRLEGVQVFPGFVEGEPCQCAEWRINQFSSKLKSCMGKPVVSSPFKACGLEELRLMVFPEGKEAKGPRSKRQKELYNKRVTEGPLDCNLKLKVPECPPPHILEYFLKVGTCRIGPFRHNFAESTVNGPHDFNIDWLKQVEADQSLTVAVEITMAPGAEAMH